MVEDRVSVGLSGELDVRAAGPLAAELLGMRGSDIVLDASGVARLGGQCLQVLLSAAATWRSDGAALSVAEPSAAFCEALEWAGLDLSALAAVPGEAALATTGLDAVEG